MKRLPARLALSLGGLLLALGLVELGVRQLAPQPPAMVQSGLRRGMFTQPGDHPVVTDVFEGTVHVNRHGFVDQEWPPRQPGLWRVLVIGDSFVQAAQVPLQTGFGRVLQEELSARFGHVEVLSAGVPGAGTATALLLLDELLPLVQPDVVIYAWTSSNDVLNNHPGLDPKTDKPFFTLQQGALVRVAPADAGVPAWAQGWLWSHSHLVRWIGRTLWVRAEVADRLARGEGIPAELRVYDPDAGAVWLEAWAVTDVLVAALAARVEADGRKFGTVLFPGAVEVSEAGRAQAVEQWPELADWDLEAAGDLAVAMAARHGPVLDLRPALTAAAQEQAQYLVGDGHWTVAGHATAAKASTDFVAGLLGLQAVEAQPKAGPGSD